MITRFFRATRSALLAIPFNPYGTIAVLKEKHVQNVADRSTLFVELVNLTQAFNTLMAQHAHSTKLNKGYNLLVDQKKAEIAKLKLELAWTEQANEMALADREELKAKIATYEVILTDLMGAYKEAETEVNALRETVGQHEGVTIPTVQAVEAELSACGVTIGQTEADGYVPKVIVNPSVLSVAMRGQRVAIAGPISAPGAITASQAA